MKLESSQIHGEIISTRSVMGIRLSESHYHPRQRLPRHQHSIPYFCLVVSGRFRETGRRGTFDCGPREVIVHPQGDLHEDLFLDNGSRCFNVEITDEAAGLGPLDAFIAQPAHLPNGPINHLSARIYREFRERDSASEMILHGLTLELAGQVARGQVRQAESRPSCAISCRELLADRFKERLTLSEIAEEIRVHPSHLARAFRHSYGHTIGEYLRQLRIAWAADAISNGTHSLVEIAVEAGFCDQSHFVRTFRRYLGMTPGEYRRLFHARQQTRKPSRAKIARRHQER